MALLINACHQTLVGVIYAAAVASTAERREGPAWWPTDRLQNELERVAVTLGTAGFADGVLVLDLGEVGVTFIGSPRDRPRRSWSGTESDALHLLSELRDGAGVPAFWAAFQSE